MNSNTDRRLHMGKIKEKNYYFYIDFLKIMAVLLIINSHMDSIYPISSLATGGSMGNALFFVTSGFLLRGKRKDARFFAKTIVKLYVSVYIVTLLLMYQPGKNFFLQFIWPTNFWFVGAILLFYGFYALLEKWKVFAHYPLFLACTAAVYFIVYFAVLDTSQWVVEAEGLHDAASCFKLIYYFAVMITGGLIRECSFSHKKVMMARIGWIASFVLLYGSKFIMDKNSAWMHWQFTSQFFTFLFAVLMLIASTESDIIQMVEKKQSLANVIKYVSSASLELYLVQFAMIYFCQGRFPFPVSFVFAIALIFLSAISLKVLIEKSAQFIERLTLKVRRRTNENS